MFLAILNSVMPNMILQKYKINSPACKSMGGSYQEITNNDHIILHVINCCYHGRVWHTNTTVLWWRWRLRLRGRYSPNSSESPRTGNCLNIGLLCQFRDKTTKFLWFSTFMDISWRYSRPSDIKRCIWILETVITFISFTLYHVVIRSVFILIISSSIKSTVKTLLKLAAPIR
jgi:hypothetical protein